MGRGEPLDTEEIKFICRQILAGRTDTQIRADLEEDWGRRDKRTIGYIRRVFEGAQEVLTERLSKIREEVQGRPSAEDMRRTIDIVDYMIRGLRPVYDESTGELHYETWMEI